MRRLSDARTRRLALNAAKPNVDDSVWVNAVQNNENWKGDHSARRYSRSARMMISFM